MLHLVNLDGFGTWLTMMTVRRFGPSWLPSQNFKEAVEAQDLNKRPLVKTDAGWRLKHPISVPSLNGVALLLKSSCWGGS